MTANELQIGDWVMLADPINKGEKVQVTAIHEDGCISFKGGITKRFRPIPLTEEILERNGFENDFYQDECVADYHYVRLEGYSYHERLILIQWCNGKLNVVNESICDVDMYDCSYVHQLQHALRLCNIEKEIEI